jgi:hypothetical protein
MSILLKLGSKGNQVTALTRKLVARGHLGQASNTFDGRVRTAVMGFQSTNLDERGIPLKVDGIVGPVTWWALEHTETNLAFDAPESMALDRIPDGGSERGRAALQVALDEIAAGAGEGGKNNDGPFVNKYLNGIVRPPAEWCAGFVSWCFDQGPGGCPYGYTLGARDTLHRCRVRGWGYDHRAEMPQPGDIVVWRRGPIDGWLGHAGLVLQTTQGGMLHTIEGNKGGFPARVRTFSYVLRAMDSLLGYARVGDV